MANVIDYFTGEYEFLSNFHVAPMIIDGREWRTVEHYFQAMKTANLMEQEAIRMAPTPGMAKRMGSKHGTTVNGKLFKIILRSDWEIFKHAVMMEALEAKFNQHPELANRLIATDPMPLIEGNKHHDNIWGNCICPEHRNVPGQNFLGQYLMEVRTKLISKIPAPPQS